MTQALGVDQINAQLQASPFIAFAGMRCIAVDTDADPRGTPGITLRMPMRPEHERGQGTNQFHGGPIAALVDTAGDFALVVGIGSGVPTINFRVDYLRPAFGPHLTAVARVRRAGRTVGVVDVDVLDAEERLVAVGRGCYSTRPG